MVLAGPVVPECGRGAEPADGPPRQALTAANNDRFGGINEGFTPQ
jgi:hypothetical protein